MSEDFSRPQAPPQPQQPSLKNTDILSLKKMVIEEIKNELELNKGLSYKPVDPCKA